MTNPFNNVQLKRPLILMSELTFICDDTCSSLFEVLVSKEGPESPKITTHKYRNESGLNCSVKMSQLLSCSRLLVGMKLKFSCVCCVWTKSSRIRFVSTLRLYMCRRPGWSPASPNNQKSRLHNSYISSNNLKLCLSQAWINWLFYNTVSKQFTFVIIDL